MVKSLKKVLVLCTGNSCRSIMAEAIINHYLGGSWQAFSAGVDPSEVNRRAIQVMAEIGIGLNDSYSKSVAEFIKRDDLDLVITVCGDARETCPMFHNPVEKIHIGIEDPAPYTYFPDEEALPKFREIRDTIKTKILDELKLRS